MISLLSLYQRMRSSQNRAGFVFFLILMSLRLVAQNDIKDIDMIKQHSILEDHIHHSHGHNPQFLLSDHPSTLIRYNPLTLVMGSMMWVYQKVVSPQFSSSCLYHPSCSAFSIDLISAYGLIPGIILTTDRLMRCNRLSLMDFRSWDLDPISGKIQESTSLYRLNE